MIKKYQLSSNLVGKIQEPIENIYFLKKIKLKFLELFFK